MSELSSAIKQVCDDKGLSYEAVIGTIESALAAAYRKDFGEKNQNIKVEFDAETGKSKVFDVKTVVEDQPEEAEEDKDLGAGPEEKPEKAGKKEAGKGAILDADAVGAAAGREKGEIPDEKAGAEEEHKFNPKTEIQLSDAKKLKKTAKLGDEIKTRLEVPDEYGRMAAQTAKQVIIQRLREAERTMIYEEFKEKENEVVSGVVQRREGRFVLMDLGKGTAILPVDEQVPSERYQPGDRLKLYIKSVNLTPKGPEIVVSRTSDEILKKIFYLEIPEIANGLIEIKAVAREAGARAKVAVAAESENVDPIGSCVGQRGARIQTIISELGGEKVDIILYDEEPVKYIANALSPARILNIELDENEKKAKVIVSPDQFSLAIGKSGQNVRLAARLTGWKVDILENKDKEEGGEEDNGAEAPDGNGEAAAEKPDQDEEPRDSAAEKAAEAAPEEKTAVKAAAEEKKAGKKAAAEAIAAEGENNAKE